MMDDDIEDHARDCNKRSGGLCDCGFEIAVLRQNGHDVPDDGSDKPLGYTTPDGHLEVRDSVDKNGVQCRGYHETELGQHDRWLRQCPDLYELYVKLLGGPERPWFMQSKHVLGWRDRLRVLFGAPVVVAFRSPNGKCHAACDLYMRVRGDLIPDEQLLSGSGLWPTPPPPAVEEWDAGV